MPSHALQAKWALLAGGAAMVATMGLLTLVAHARQPAAAASELLVRVPRSPQLWLGENW
jgi:hypothetical protein